VSLRRAARVDANQSAIVSALRAAGARVWVIGLPVDLLVGHAGRWMLLEVKDGAKIPSKQKKTPIQAKFFADAAGLPTALVDGPDAALRALGVLEHG
jgi:hypothetical protein